MRQMKKKKAKKRGTMRGNKEVKAEEEEKEGRMRGKNKVVW